MPLSIALTPAGPYDEGDTIRATVTATSPETFTVTTTWKETRSPTATVDSGLRFKGGSGESDLSWDDPQRTWTRISMTATTLVLEATA